MLYEYIRKYDHLRAFYTIGKPGNARLAGFVQ